MLPVAQSGPARTPGSPSLRPTPRIGRASIFYAPSQVPCPITALKPIAALPRSSSRRNKFMQYLLTAYIDRLRPLILVLAQRKTAAEQRLCAPSRSHLRANVHPYTARNQNSVSHTPRVNAPSRTYRAKPAACYQTVMQHWLHIASFTVAHIQLNISLFLPSPRASTLTQRGKIGKTHPNSHRPHLLPPSSSESDVMSTMTSLGAASDSRLTQTQLNPSQRSRVLLLSYP
ncbi:hypothetical protein B0H16DRAFT_1524897 [Mycena metata]|uniref:Uncharacterized protein n=1 Tax=Mycena metata TaxID=1033252 RepID=A0AAD7JKI0_9AGAR|nr:hypothetical protein B0H16DRAFT_1524897 [Mycena metata]